MTESTTAATGQSFINNGLMGTTNPLQNFMDHEISTAKNKGNGLA